MFSTSFARISTCALMCVKVEFAAVRFMSSRWSGRSGSLMPVCAFRAAAAKPGLTLPRWQGRQCRDRTACTSHEGKATRANLLP